LKKISYLISPLGSIELVTFKDTIIALQFCDKTSEKLVNDSLHHEANRQINDYFAGTLKTFSLPLHYSGTSFQEKAWHALKTIPYGETISYQQQLLLMGYTKGCQAVGQANKKNPIQIIIPCHRVILQSGELGGYAGKDNVKKKWLLANEKLYKVIF
jgi:methylated-DNA-[protein]-cysteine S-methyltransferase